MQVAAKLFFIISPLENSSRNCIYKNVQNERAAIIARWCSKGIGDVAPTSGWAKVVNRALFTLLANLWTCTGLHCLPICEAVQLCPACRFMQAENSGRIISKLGIVLPYYRWSIRPQAEILFSHFWIYAQLGYKWFWKIFRPNLFPIWEQVKCQIPYLSPIWREVIFISDELSEISLPDNLSES